MEKDDLYYFKKAIADKDIKVVKELIGNLGEKIHLQNEFCLRSAVNCGNLEIVKLIIDNGGKISDTGENLLSAACMLGHLDIVKYLVVDKKMDVNYSDNSPLWNSLCCREYDISYYLLENHITEYSNLLTHTGLEEDQKDWLKKYKESKEMKEKLTKELNNKKIICLSKKSKV